MYTNQQKLYAIKLKRLHDLYVVKSNIHLTYKYKNQNKAIHNAQSLQDKIINSIINDAIYGNSDKSENYTQQPGQKSSCIIRITYPE